MNLERYFGIAGKVVLITGSTGGIGSAMTEAMADAGAKLVVASVDAENCLAQAQTLRSRGVEAEAVPTDVRKAADLLQLADTALARFGRIDVLICNAGISGHFGSLAQADEAAYVEAFDINLRHPLTLCGRVAPLMAQQGGGSIVLTSSIAGLRGNAKIGLYGLTKAALAQLARNLAVEYGPQGVRANAIAPGLTNTGWAAGILSNPAATAKRLGQTPLRRIGEPWEMAAAALFLSGPGSAFITGQTLVVDGGTLISDGN